jgi:hypothetical protein
MRPGQRKQGYERLLRGVRDEEVAGSNPVTPTSKLPSQQHIQMLTSGAGWASTAGLSPRSLQVAAALRCSGRARVGADLHRDRLIGMLQDSHDHMRLHIEVNEQLGTSVPGVMNGQPTHSLGVGARCELPVESARIDRSAMTPGEDK